MAEENPFRFIGHFGDGSRDPDANNSSCSSTKGLEFALSELASGDDEAGKKKVQSSSIFDPPEMKVELQPVEIKDEDVPDLPIDTFGPGVLMSEEQRACEATRYDGPWLNSKSDPIIQAFIGVENDHDELPTPPTVEEWPPFGLEMPGLPESVGDPEEEFPAPPEFFSRPLNLLYAEDKKIPTPLGGWKSVKMDSPRMMEIDENVLEKWLVDDEEMEGFSGARGTPPFPPLPR